MKKFWLILPVILALGIGCLNQKPIAPTDTPPIPQVENVEIFGVLDGWDAQTGIADVRLVNGVIEEVRWPAEAEDPTAQVGLLVTVTGTRDAATLAIFAERASFPSVGNLIVLSPVSDATVTSPLLVQGFGRVFEQTFSWRIKQADGSIVAEGYAMTDATDIGRYGPFQFEVFLPAMNEKPFTFEVLQYSAKDGSEQDLVSVPLQLLSIATTTFDIYFSNASKGSNEDCSRAFPVSRTVAQTSAVGRAAILELLAGPTSEERTLGYATNIPENTRLNSLVISDETAKADFSSGLQFVAGSCRVIAIRSQIENTLLQFSTVSDVVISIEGEVDTALQP